VRRLPFDPSHPAAQGFERGRLAQTGHLSVEAQPTFLERLLQVNQEQVSEPAAQDLHRQKE